MNNEYKVIIDGQSVVVRTHRLPGAPYTQYDAYLSDSDKPILSLISRPGDDDLRDAINKRKGKR